MVEVVVGDERVTVVVSGEGFSVRRVLVVALVVLSVVLIVDVLVVRAVVVFDATTMVEVVANS